jgi:Zn-dependent M28 family amino/carboxypeptidase
MDPKIINTFSAYSMAVDQRSKGAAAASKFGALGVIVRSMNLKQDDHPHTGGMSYGDLSEVQMIPAAAISTNSADYLSTTLKLNPSLKFYFKQNCKTMPDVLSHNVIGEIRGSEFPEEVIVVGGHLDSWDVGDGAHDDGAGCVQSMAVLEILNKIGYKPKRTIRVVLFMNEENGLRGGTQYAKVATYGTYSW